MEWPRISIVTPSYNQVEFLEETIKSVIDQDYPNLEYILIDGGSNDGSLNIIKKYSHYFSHWESGPDSGQANAINKGLAGSTGQILGWLNSDDILLPGSLERVAKFFMNFPRVDFLYGNRKVINEESETIGVKENLVLTRFLLRYGSPFAQEATFWRRNVMEVTGMLNEEFKFCLDYDFYCRVAKSHRMAYLPFFLGSFRIHNKSKTRSMTEIQNIEDSIIQANYFHHSIKLNAQLKRYLVVLFKYLSIYSGYYFAYKSYIKWKLES